MTGPKKVHASAICGSRFHGFSVWESHNPSSTTSSVPTNEEHQRELRLTLKGTGPTVVC